MIDRSTIGAMLKAYRTVRKLTHDDLATRAGVSIGTISNLERGLSQRPRIDTIQMLADGLQLTGAEHDQFIAAARGGSPAPLGAVSGSHNLPQDLPGFIGRERDIAQVRMLVRQQRFVTLTGIGGVGKTRLALAAAEGLLHDFADGLFFIDLAPLRDPALVLPTILATLGVPEDGQRSNEERLQRYLHDKTLLLILDNFEHLLPATLPISNLLASSPKLSILITSRKKLRLPDEAPFLVTPLDLPEHEQHSLPQVLAGYEAIRLFATRAQAARHGVALPLDTLPTVLKICRVLDGLPLAIELAAVRCAVLSPAEILDRLRNRLGLLTQGRSKGPSRHLTLQTALAWSYELLDPVVQTLFRHLAVFSGGCTLEATEAVCNLKDNRDLATIDGLQELVQHNLLRAALGAGGAMRYAMLETVREYALACLQKAREETALRQQHAAYYLGMAEQAKAVSRTPQETDWLDTLEREHDNLRAALTWAIEHGRAGLAQHLGAALWRFWYLRGHLEEGHRWLERALGDATEGTTASRGAATVAAGIVTRFLGDHTRAGELLTTGHRLCREAGDDRGLALALAQLGYLAIFRGDEGCADAYLIESEELCRSGGDTPGLALALHYRGMAARGRGDLHGARELHSESLARQRQIGDIHGIAHALQSLGAIARDLGEARAARAWHEEGLALFRQVLDAHGAAMQLNHLGVLDRDAADWAGARARHEESLDLYRQLGDPHGATVSLQHLGELAYAHGDYIHADTLFRHCLSLHRSQGHAAGIIDMVEGLAASASVQGASARAARLYGAAMAEREARALRRHAGDEDGHGARLAACRADLGEAEYTEVITAGRAASLDEIVAAEIIGATTPVESDPKGIDLPQTAS